MFDGGVDEISDLGEFDNLIHFAADRVAAHAIDRAVEKHVFSPSEVRVKAGAKFKQGCNAPPDVHLTAGWR